jgi:predicted TIM-barrel fold metal-dependent hydrolase
MAEKISRRQALAGAGAIGLAAAAPAAFAAPDWDKPIDLHMHVEPGTPDYAPFGTTEQMVMQNYASRLAYMDRLGITKAIVSAGYRYRAMNDMIAAFVAKNPARFPAGIGVVEVKDGDASLKELERMAKDLKLRGVGWHHGDGGVYIDNPYMRPLLKQTQALGLIPFIHVREKEFEAWWRLEVLLEEFPDMTFVAMSGLVTTDDREHAMQVCRRRKNLLVDTAPALYGGDQFFPTFVKAVGAERVLFGSDNAPTLTLEVIRRSALSDHDKALVLSGNTAKLFGLKV